jgi:proline dehydrogenase
MMRNTLLWASTNPLLAERLPKYDFVKRATKRFMPGETLDDALGEAERLGKSDLSTIVTLLGENLAAEDEADAVVDHYLGALETIEERGLPSEVSVKLTQLGLDFGTERTEERVRRLASATSSLLWIDMENSDCVDATLDVFRKVRETNENVGVCLQSYLHRTQRDLEALMPLEPSIRLVKGAYNKPPDVAYARKGDVDQNFVRLTKTLLRARLDGGQGRPVFATHDPRMIGEANRLAYEMGLKKDRYEFAMLYGIERDKQLSLARAGHSVRVLVSYGSAWFPWYMRRLAERPANVWFVVKQLVR